MKNTKLVIYSLISSLGVLGYISLVGWVMINGDRLFGNETAIVGIAAFLLLFVFSTLITGLLVLGGPIYLYLEKNKKTAIKMLFCNIGWLAIITACVLLLLLK